TLAGFWICCVLGFMSQLMFVLFYGAVGAWSVFRLARQWRGAGTLLVLHAPILTALTLFYAIDISKMKVGAAPAYTVIGVVTETLSRAVGGPASGIAAIGFAVGACALLAGALRLLWRQRSDDWFFYLLAIVLVPTVLV